MSSLRHNLIVASVLFIALGSLVAATSLGAQGGASAKYPALGTWKENVQKSTYNPGPAPKTGALRRYELRPDGFTVVTQTNVDAQGNPTLALSAFKIDGREYPNYNRATIAELLATGTKTKGTTSAKLVDAYTVIVTQRNDAGVVGIPTTRTVSKDGKTMTSTTKGTNAQGQAVNNVVIFDRVQ